MDRTGKLPARDLNISKGVFVSCSEGETLELGYRLGREFRQGVVALIGDLGSGKTVFAKGFAQAIGVRRARTQVVSPSFPVIREHGGSSKLIHADLYRIESCDDPAVENLRDYFFQDCVVLIEWAEKCAGLLPKARLEVCFEILGVRKRRITVSRSA